jgi:hypothetical protein
MDYVTTLPKTARGNAGLFDVVDRLRKLIPIAATPANVDAPEVARLFYTHVYRHHELPLEIISDRDPMFMSKFWTTLFGMLRVKLRPASAYHPETNGQTEVVNHKVDKSFVFSSIIINPSGNFSQLTWNLPTIWLQIARPRSLPLSSHMKLTPEVHPSV